MAVPANLALPPVAAMAPFARQIDALKDKIGAVVARKTMKDKSGASVMDPSSQVTSGLSHSALEPLEANFALPLVHEIANENDHACLDVAVAAEVSLVGDPILAAADAARDAGNAPNAVMSSAVAIVGPKRVERALKCTDILIELFTHYGLQDGSDEGFDDNAITLDDDARTLFLAGPKDTYDPVPEAMLSAVAARSGKSVFLKFLGTLDARLICDAILAASALTISWGPLMRKWIAKLTARTLPWYLRPTA